MKRSVTAIIVCLILTLCLAAGGADKNDAPDNTDNVQIPAPWTDYASADEASAEAGFTIETPESIGNCGFDFARVFDDGMLELFYTDGNGGGVSVRKAAGQQRQLRRLQRVRRRHHDLCRGCAGHAQGRRAGQLYAGAVELGRIFIFPVAVVAVAGECVD